MAVANKEGALARVATDPVSRRKLLAVTGGSTALAAFLAACGSDSDTMSGSTTGGGETGTEQFGKGDLGILNYALTLEYLESAFYKEAKRRARASGDLKALIETISRDEDEHVGALTETIKKLGGKPVAAPKFDLEARHAAAIALQNGAEPSPLAFDPALSETKVMKAVEPFIA